VLGWNDTLAPGHRRDPSGSLLVGGASAASLAAAHGTPLIVIDAALLEVALERLRSICKPLGVNVSYAAKAFLCEPLARLLASRSIGMDVCSLGELDLAERSGFPADRLTLHGAGKTDAELRAVLAGRVGRVVLDGLTDLRRLAQLADGSLPANVLLRLNTGLDVDTHRHVKTVGEASKFGLAPQEEADAIELLRSAPSLEFEGLHAHAGSQIANPATLAANVRELAEAADRFAAQGLVARTLIAGGGFGIQYDPSRPHDALDAGAAVAACSAALSSRGLSARPVLEFEPGRSIIAHAGTTIYEVMSVKRRGDRTFVVVDGGMADNPRPALYGAYHHIVPVVATSGPQRLAAIFGRACEDDFIAEALLPADLERGSLLAACTTGAYTYSMSSNYNGFDKPRVVAVSHGAHEVWVD
jgi:diaminopimelate decarboxylase